MDSAGECCLYELTATRACAYSVDSSMASCEGGALDAAGTCNGAAQTIDYTGAGCNVSLPLT